MSTSSLGLISATYAIAPVFLALAVGRLVDRRSELPFLIAAVMFHGVGAMLLIAAGNTATVLACVAMVGLCQLVAVIAVQTMIGSRSPIDSYDERFGSFAFAISLGQLFGPIIGGLIATQAVTDGEAPEAGTAAALVFGASLSLLALPFLGWMAIRDPGPHASFPPSAASTTTIRSLLSTHGMIPMLLASMAVLAAMDVITVFLPAIGVERGLSVATVGALLAVRAGAAMASRLLVGRMVGWFGRRRLITGSMLIAAAAISSLGFVPVPVMFVSMAVVGMTLGVSQPITTAWVAARAAPGARATAMSIRLLGNRIGQVVIPLAAGLVAAISGSGSVLTAIGLTVATAAVVVSTNDPDD